MTRVTKKLLLALGLSLTTGSPVYSYELYKIINEHYQVKNNAFNIPTKEIQVTIKNDLIIELEDIDDLLTQNSLDLQNHKLRVDQNKHLLRSALSAWYPKLNLTSNGLPKYLDGYTYNEPDSSNNTISRQWSSSASVEVKWDLINPKRKPEINIARKNLEKAKLTYTIKYRDLKLIALKEYFKLQQSYEDVRIAEKSVAYSELMLDESKSRLNAGIGTKLDVLQAQTQLARDMQLLSEKEGEKRYTQRSLAEALNLPQQTTPSVKSRPKIIGLWDSSLEQSIIASYTFRKEVKNLLLDISINSNNADSAIASTRPTVSLFNNFTTTFSNGQTSVSSPDMDNKTSAINNTVGISAQWLLIDGGNARALYKYNKSKAKESEISVKSSLAKIRKEVERSFFNLETARQNILTTNKEIISSKESLRLARLKFKSGITTQREVVNHQRELTEAEVNNIRAVTDYNIHLSDLRRQTGLDKIKYCIKENMLSTMHGESNLIHLCRDKIKEKT